MRPPAQVQLQILAVVVSSSLTLAVGCYVGMQGQLYIFKLTAWLQAVVEAS